MPRLSQPRAARSIASGRSPSETLPPPTLAKAARLAAAALNQEQRLQTAQALVALAGRVGSGSSDDLEGWLGPAPADPVALELRSLRQRFELRRQLLSGTISADEVAAESLYVV